MPSAPFRSASPDAPDVERLALQGQRRRERRVRLSKSPPTDRLGRLEAMVAELREQLTRVEAEMAVLLQDSDPELARLIVKLLVEQEL